MSKVEKVEDVIKAIKSTNVDKDGKVLRNRFSKKNYERLLTAMVNDPEYKTIVANVRKGELEGKETISVSELFRKYIQKVVESAGIDSAESAKVLEADFTFGQMSGFYEILAASMYEYMDLGNNFELLPTEDFRGLVFVKDQPSSTRIHKANHPRTREYLGEIEVKKAPHKTLGVKSSCPLFLRERRKVK